MARPTTGKGEQRGENGGLRRGLVESELLEHATRLFAERGFAGTTLQDIADAMGLSRPSLYHYVKNKDELLARLVEDITTDAARQAKALARRTDLDAAGKLEALVRWNVRRMADKPDRFRLVERSESSLPPALVKAHLEGRRQVLDTFIKVIREGAETGQFRPVDERTAALAIIGMTNWVAWWYRPGSDHPIQPIEDAITEQALRGILQGDARTAGHNGVASAFARLRQDVEELERIVTRQRQQPT
ncbi:MAG TPA: TetR/AcrR family transcriptional regulator [Acidimicrobiia bacterium]|jgi:AcrR family transcriptional regulator|nr:TetR/AcrR family transcriptional regulator [Acidimicrobiia bacterium]